MRAGEAVSIIGRVEHAVSSVHLVSAGTVLAEVLADHAEGALVGAAAGAVHGEHAAPLGPAPGGVIRVVVEDHHVAGVALHRDVAGKVFGRDAELRLDAVPHVDLAAPDEMVRILAAGDHAQSRGVSPMTGSR